jgi:hypothetical protein
MAAHIRTPFLDVIVKENVVAVSGLLPNIWMMPTNIGRLLSGFVL